MPSSCLSGRDQTRIRAYGRDHRPPQPKTMEVDGSRCYYDAGKKINGQAPCTFRVGAALAQLLHIARRYA